MNEQPVPGENINSLEALMHASNEHSLSFAQSSESVRKCLQGLLHIRGEDSKTTESLTDKLADATEDYKNAFGEYSFDLVCILDMVHSGEDQFERKIRRVASEIAREAQLRRNESAPSTPERKPERIGFLLRLASNIDRLDDDVGESDPSKELQAMEEETLEQLREHYEATRNQDASENQSLSEAAMSLVEEQIIAEHSLQPQYFIEKDAA